MTIPASHCFERVTSRIAGFHLLPRLTWVGLASRCKSAPEVSSPVSVLYCHGLWRHSYHNSQVLWDRTAATHSMPLRAVECYAFLALIDNVMIFGGHG